MVRVLQAASIDSTQMLRNIPASPALGATEQRP